MAKIDYAALDMQIHMTDKQKRISRNAAIGMKDAWRWLKVHDDHHAYTLSVIEKRYDSKANQYKPRTVSSLSGDKVRVIMYIIRDMMRCILSDDGVPAEYDKLLDDNRYYRGCIPLDETTAAKLGLIFRLSADLPKTKLDKVELIALRINLFTREEASYWLGKTNIPVYGDGTLAWAITGLRTMLCGARGDAAEEQLIRETIDSIRVSKPRFGW